MLSWTALLATREKDPLRTPVPVLSQSAFPRHGAGCMQCSPPARSMHAKDNKTIKALQYPDVLHEVGGLVKALVLLCVLRKGPVEAPKLPCLLQEVPLDPDELHEAVEPAVALRLLCKLCKVLLPVSLGRGRSRRNAQTALRASQSYTWIQGMRGGPRGTDLGPKWCLEPKWLRR